MTKTKITPKKWIEMITHDVSERKGDALLKIMSQPFFTVKPEIPDETCESCRELCENPA